MGAEDSLPRVSVPSDRDRLGRIGVWAAAFRLGDPSEIAEGAAELEQLGYGAAWVPGVAMPGTVAACEPLLAATEELMVNTGVVNIWVEEAADVAAEFARIDAEYPGRMLVGLGISHEPLIGDRYVRPLAYMRDYLDKLDAADPPLAAERRLLGAIGPKSLELARERSRGSHPYLMPPEHTAIAREALGEDALLCPEQTVVLEADPERARELGRKWLSTYTRAAQLHGQPPPRPGPDRRGLRRRRQRPPGGRGGRLGRRGGDPQAGRRALRGRRRPRLHSGRRRAIRTSRARAGAGSPMP